MQFPPNIQENVEMKPFTTFRAGGKARFFAKAESVEEIVLLKKFADKRSVPFFMLGLGSNVVVSDSGFDGLIVKLGKSFSHFRFDKETLSAKAATPLSMIARTSATLGLSGMHLLAGIPGTVGGAVVMNAGAYGEEISNTVVSVKVLDKNFTLQDFSAKDCDFSYRHSRFQGSGMIVLEASFKLSHAAPAELIAEQSRVLAERKAKQPLEFPSAGSVFKRNEKGFPGALIEQAGLKGFRMGGAQISAKHANFIVNVGGATAQEIFDLSELARAKVFEKSGVELEREILFLGKF